MPESNSKTRKEKQGEKWLNIKKNNPRLYSDIMYCVYSYNDIMYILRDHYNISHDPQKVISSLQAYNHLRFSQTQDSSKSSKAQTRPTILNTRTPSI